MNLYDLLRMRMGGPGRQFGFQAPSMSAPTPPQQFQAPGMSAPQPPMQFTPPRMSQPTPPQAFGQQGFAQAVPGLWGRFSSPEHNRAGWMGARAPWGFEP